MGRINVFAETGVSSRLPFRKMFTSYDDIDRDINKFKTFSNIYHSIYWCKQQEEKFDVRTGKVSRLGPQYETALIDKVCLDLDSYEKTKLLDEQKNFESYTPRGLDDMRKMEEWASERNILRQYRFSGGGMYFIFSAKGHPLKLRDFEITLHNELNVNIDVSTIGDTSRMMRVTNSFNFKKHRLCFCIPLTQDEIYLKYEEIKALASEPRVGESYLYGTETYSFNHHKVDKDKIKMKRLFVNLKQAKKQDANMILKKHGWELDDICPTIKGILSLGHVGNAMRYELLKYFKTIIKTSFDEAVGLMVAFLGTEGLHSAVEGQARIVYGKDKSFNPEWKLKALGYCDPNCTFCNRYKSVVWNAIEKIKLNKFNVG